MKPSNTEVIYATLHTAIFVPGGVVGSVGPVLATDRNGGKLRDIKMFISEDGRFLCLNIKGSEVIVPAINVSHMVLKKAEK